MCLGTLIIIPTVCLFLFEAVKLWMFGRLQEVKFDLIVTGSSCPDSMSSFWYS